MQCGQLARGQHRVVADAAAVLDRHLRRGYAVLVRVLPSRPQQAVGNQVAEVRLAAADVAPHPVQRHVTGGHDLFGERGHVLGHRLLHLGAHHRVTVDRVGADPGHPHRLGPLVVHADDGAVPVEVQHEPAHVLVVPGDRDHGHRPAVGVGGVQREAPLGHVARDQPVAVIGEDLAAARAHHGVHPAQPRHQREFVVDVLQMADQHHLVDTAPGEVARERVRDLGQLRAHVDVAGAGDRGKLGCGQADDADPFTRRPQDTATGERAVGGVRGQFGLARDVQVRADERHLVARRVEEPVEHVRSEVEVVVAERAEVVADVLQRERVVERGALPCARRVLGPGEEVVPARHGDRTAVPGVPRRGPAAGRLRPQLVHQGRHARRAAVRALTAVDDRPLVRVTTARHPEQCGLHVAREQHGQGEVDPAGAGRGGGKRHRAQQRRRGERAQPGLSEGSHVGSSVGHANDVAPELTT